MMSARETTPGRFMIGNVTRRERGGVML
jgi:hypothetical protein